MVAVASCFAQILSLIDRAGFARAVRQHQAERAAKGFSCWDHFVAMLFCQMGSGRKKQGRESFLIHVIAGIDKRYLERYRQREGLL